MSEISTGKGSMSLSFAASLVVHVVLLLAAAIPSVRERLIPAPDFEDAAPPQAQTWAGETAELAAGETLYDVQLTGAAGVVPEPPAAPSAPAAPPEAPEPPAPPETSPKTPPPAEEPARPAPKPESERPAKAETARPKPPPVEEEEDPYADVSLPPKPAKEPAPKPAKEPAPKTAKEPAKEPANEPAKPAESSVAAQPNSGLGGTGTSGGSFGAVGKAGVRDLGAAFTQAIPAACGADMTWSEIGLGDGGTVQIAIDIDENGRPKSFTVLDKNPPKQLQNVAKRTFGLLQSGTFALRSGSVTAGRQTVEVSATVGMTDKPVTSGGLIELSHAFENGVGKAHFVQSTGREVRFRVRVIRVEVTAAPAGD